MLAALRRHLLTLLCFAAAGAIGVVAIADHRDKQRRIDRAQVGEWYCAHVGTECYGPSSEKIERHWQERQWGYEIAVVALSAFALVRFGYRLAKPQ